jgi:hypothetical protein
MQNLAMQRKLEKLECLDVGEIGLPISPGVYQLSKFTEDADYCDAKHEAWIWSIGKRLSDGQIFAAIDTRFYQHPDYECLWLR